MICVFAQSFSLCFLIFVLTSQDLTRVDVQALNSESIQGGFIAKLGFFPYHVHIQTDYGTCGGSIIHEKYIATAAHCIITTDGIFIDGEVKIVAGVVDLTVRPLLKIERRIDKFYVLKNFRRHQSSSIVSDVAVLRLAEALRLDRRVSKLDLPKAPQDYTGKAANVTGYGVNGIKYQRVGGSIEITQMYRSYKLHYAKPKILSRTLCQAINRDITESSFCAKIVQSSAVKPEGVCYGDSGGPLVYGKTLIGILYIAADTCDEVRYPAIYANVSFYRDFFDKALEDICDSDFMVCSIV